MKKRNALVIGATGLLGYNATLKLVENGWKVKAIGIENLDSSNFFPPSVQYICGDFYNEDLLKECLVDIDKVFYFLSTTFPSSSSTSLELEINRSVKGLDYLLRTMNKANVKSIVFPSSGGTIYGNVKSGLAKETDPKKPISPYGFGKKICEDILLFYSYTGISCTILRVGNVYGSSFYRNVNQGVIDLFVQKALQGETLSIWNNALHNERDYIFVDDFAEAVASVAEIDEKGFNVYNVGSGVGVTLSTIIEIINKNCKEHLNIEYLKNDTSSSIERVVLDITKLCIKTGWHPFYDIESGIVETIKRKKAKRELL